MISKFETQEEKEKKEQRTKKIMSYFVVSVLFFSVAAYAFMSFGSESSGEKYGKFSFVELADGWQTKINGFFIFTSYHPKEVEDIKYQGVIETGEFDNIIYFVAKTEAEKGAAEEMNKNIFSLKKEFACLPEDLSSGLNNEECLNLTAKSCSDASYIQKIIVFNEAQGNASVSYANNCMIISGENKEDMIMAADKALFVILGIIKQ